MNWKTFTWIGLGCYALLSVADFGLTSALLRANDGAYESNPIAAAALEQHGWRGLAMYKAGGVVAFAASLILLIRHRPKVGAGIVTFGCVVLLSVTTYSYGLLRDTYGDPAFAPPVRIELIHAPGPTTVLEPDEVPTPGRLIAQ